MSFACRHVTRSRQTAEFLPGVHARSACDSFPAPKTWTRKPGMQTLDAADLNTFIRHRACFTLVVDFSLAHFLT
jgi:hypothetical protein